MPPIVTTVSHPFSMTSARMYSSFLILLPESSLPVKSSRLTNSSTPRCRGNSLSESESGCSGVGTFARLTLCVGTATSLRANERAREAACRVIWEFIRTLSRSQPRRKRCLPQHSVHLGIWNVTTKSTEQPQISNGKRFAHVLPHQVEAVCLAALHADQHVGPHIRQLNDQ